MKDLKKRMTLLKAFYRSTDYDENKLNNFCKKPQAFFRGFKTRKTKIGIHIGRQIFMPVINHSIDNTPWVAIRAAFHESIKGMQT